MSKLGIYNGKTPAVIKGAIDGLVRLGEGHGLVAVNHAYAEAVAELMAIRERDVWRMRVAEGQREMALLESH